MREIKFRAWLKDKQVMKKIRSIEWAGIEVSSGFIKHIDTVNDRYYSKDYNDKGNYILMQYTGLKDKNGKEIYEGDIVEYLYWGTETCKEVKWQDDTSGFYPFADFPENCGCCGMGKNPKDVEVIGNIYENPELLERENK